AAVVVDAQRVDRPGDLGQVAVANVGEVADRGEVGQHVVGVAPPQDRVVPEAVRDAVDASGGVAVELRVATGEDRVGGERESDLRALGGAGAGAGAPPG